MGAVGALGAAHTEHRRLTFLTNTQAREALATTDESTRRGRKVSAAALIEYAERVSYSNAAPILTLTLTLTRTRTRTRTR